MSTKAADRRRPTTLVPVTTLEEIPVLSASEHDELLNTLKSAEAEIAAGRGREFEPDSFKRRLIEVFKGDR